MQVEHYDLILESYRRNLMLKVVVNIIQSRNVFATLEPVGIKEIVTKELKRDIVHSLRRNNYGFIYILVGWGTHLGYLNNRITANITFYVESEEASKLDGNQIYGACVAVKERLRVIALDNRLQSPSIRVKPVNILGYYEPN